MLFPLCLTIFRAGRIGTTYTFLSPEEILYLADLKLYIGKTFSSKGDVNDFSIVFLLV